MKKPKITQTPWTAEKLHLKANSRQLGQMHLMNFKHDNSGRYIQDHEGEENAKAIVIAVNNTYGKNINPEAIEEVIEALKAIKDEVEKQCSIGSDPRFKRMLQLWLNSHEALKNIKFNQE